MGLQFNPTMKQIPKWINDLLLWGCKVWLPVNQQQGLQNFKEKWLPLGKATLTIWLPKAIFHLLTWNYSRRHNRFLFVRILNNCLAKHSLLDTLKIMEQQEITQNLKINSDDNTKVWLLIGTLVKWFSCSGTFGQVILKALINSEVNYEHWKQNWQEKCKFQR